MKKKFKKKWKILKLLGRLKTLELWLHFNKIRRASIEEEVVQELPILEEVPIWWEEVQWPCRHSLIPLTPHYTESQRIELLLWLVQRKVNSKLVISFSTLLILLTEAIKIMLLKSLVQF